MRLAPFLCVFLLLPSAAGAEKIHYRDGRVVNAQILSREGDTFWIRHNAGSVGISARDVTSIENDDGSVSKYSAVSAYSSIKDMIAAKRYPQAVKACDNLLKSFPDNSEALFLRALLSQKAGDNQQAINDYQALIKGGTDNALVYNNLGTIYAGMGRLDEATGLLKEAAIKDPESVEIRNNLGDLFLQNGSFGRAADEYTKVIEKEPGNAKAGYNLGYAYFKSGDLIKAREQWERAVSVDSGNSEAVKALELIAGAPQQ